MGKTTGVKLLLQSYPHLHYALAEETLSPTVDWITEQWNRAKDKSTDPILVIDEIQKVSRWSERIKWLWDSERFKGSKFKLVLLGSSSLHIQEGLGESLAGRFEMIPAHHWSYQESKEGLGYSLKDYLYFGGYPEASKFRQDPDRWRPYLISAIIEAAIVKDILTVASVRKPSLFRQTFEVISQYPAQERSVCAGEKRV